MKNMRDRTTDMMLVADSLVNWATRWDICPCIVAGDNFSIPQADADGGSRCP